MAKTLEEITREAERKEYTARCDEVVILRRKLEETERAGEDIRRKNCTLIYERDRARELQAGAETRFCEVLADREALKDQLEKFANKCQEYAQRINACVGEGSGIVDTLKKAVSDPKVPLDGSDEAYVPQDANELYFRGVLLGDMDEDDDD